MVPQGYLVTCGSDQTDASGKDGNCRKLILLDLHGDGRSVVFCGRLPINSPHMTQLNN